MICISQKKAKAVGLQNLCILSICDFSQGIDNHCEDFFFFCLISILFSKAFIEQYVKINFILYAARLLTAIKTGISRSHMHGGKFVH